MNLIAIIKGWFRTDLTRVLGLFDKVHAKLDQFIAEAEADAKKLEAALFATKTNLDTATTAKTVLTNLTSAPNTVEAPAETTETPAS